MVVKNAAFSDPTLLPNILAVLPEGMFLCTDETHGNTILYANDAAQKMLPCIQGGLTGRHLKECLAECFGDSRIDEKLSQAITSGRSETVQIENRKAGVVSWVSLTLTPLNRYFICRIDNMCDRQMNELKLAEARKLEALGQMAGGVAHDFNNLLSIISGYARIAAKQVQDNPEVVDYLDRIQQSVRHGASLTGQLLAFGRKNIIQQDIYDLGELICDYEALFKPLLDASVTLQVNVEKDIFVECAPDTISQILMNIIINARDAMPSGGSIYLEVDQCKNFRSKGFDGKAANYARITVRDTGQGMDIETQRRIFDPFFTTKTQGKGTGLGMSIVYGFVKQMKGFIEVDSDIGHGTSIRLYFPLSDKRKKRQVTYADRGEGANVVRLEGYTALIAEDEPDLLTLIASMLSDMGMNVLTAGDGNQALAVQEDYDGKIDFLVTDIVMPEMNGVKLAELFGSLHPDAKTLFISGYPSVGKMARVALPEGANLLPKPLVYDQLAYTLRDMAEESTHEGLLRMAGEMLADG
jgi:two-component system cell cycle sensor histidine kinase/response regulator CckA